MPLDGCRTYVPWKAGCAKIGSARLSSSARQRMASNPVRPGATSRPPAPCSLANRARGQISSKGAVTFGT